MAEALKTSRYTSIKTRIETCRPHRCRRHGHSPLATLPSKQGLKLVLAVFVLLKQLPLATLPSKQGLKRQADEGYRTRPEPLATLPSKQGLKLLVTQDDDGRPRASRYTSIKTRIETNASKNGRACKNSSRYTSIKTRIETTTVPGQGDQVLIPLATLPSKQGLKLIPIDITRVIHAEHLSLHFHQNKD